MRSGRVRLVYAANAVLEPSAIRNLGGASRLAPFPERVAGDPVSYAFDAATSTFTFRYRPDASVAAPTILSVPARVYPSGFTVECGGCTHVVSPGHVTVTAPSPGDVATITLHP